MVVVVIAAVIVVVCCVLFVVVVVIAVVVLRQAFMCKQGFVEHLVKQLVLHSGQGGHLKRAFDKGASRKVHATVERPSRNKTVKFADRLSGPQRLRPHAPILSCLGMRQP